MLNKDLVKFKMCNGDYEYELTSEYRKPYDLDSRIKEFSDATGEQTCNWINGFNSYVWQQFTPEYQSNLPLRIRLNFKHGCHSQGILSGWSELWTLIVDGVYQQKNPKYSKHLDYRISALLHFGEYNDYDAHYIKLSKPSLTIRWRRGSRPYMEERYISNLDFTKPFSPFCDDFNVVENILKDLDWEYQHFCERLEEQKAMESEIVDLKNYLKLKYKIIQSDKNSIRFSLKEKNDFEYSLSLEAFKK